MIQRTQCQSKKNKVFLVKTPKDTYIEKKFASKESFQREALVWSWLTERGLPVPKCILADEKECTILYEYLSGETLLCSLEENTTPQNAEALGVWLAALHNIFMKEDGSTLLVGDVNLRNFIIDASTIYAIDFEEYHYDLPIKDVAGVIAFLQNYSLSEEKIALYQSAFLKGYLQNQHIDPHALAAEIEHWSSVLLQRRKHNNPK